MPRSHILLALFTASLVSACQMDDGAEPDVAEKQAPKVAVCHIPPGNPANAHTIEVGQPAVAAHLAHGDHVGACAPQICTPGAQTGCYGGPAGTQGVGVCRGGTRTCNAAGTAYGPCTGEILPGAETCGDARDNDCDGMIDDGCVCTAGAPAACYDGAIGTEDVGVCRAGVKACNATGTAYGACAGAITPSVEICGDGFDNDCDGVSDDGCVCMPATPAACYDGPPGTMGVGVCAAGAQVCNLTGSGYGPCVGSIGPAYEVCGDGLDNDCNGVVDDGCIGDRVWQDLDRDGLQGPGEPGQGGVELSLHDANRQLVATTTSDAAGRYYFSAVAPGQYFVVVVPPPGTTPTITDAGLDTLDSDFYFDYGDDDGNGAGFRTPLFTFPPYTAEITIDAGLVTNDET